MSLSSSLSCVVVLFDEVNARIMASCCCCWKRRHEDDNGLVRACLLLLYEYLTAVDNDDCKEDKRRRLFILDLRSREQHYILQISGRSRAAMPLVEQMNE